MEQTKVFDPGVLGVMYAYPISDAISILLAGIMLIVEMKGLNKLIKQNA